ncbi:probable pre-mRNA-splicing factor ATP-dependent RNA helicase DEAH2 isoform X1 [Olea europaea subsp. europaea]|uniref:Probable pre-mRNA-splicing factor ATP-dependent RNA helicase DEAH2 isoform X1 n=1 Tax=Olea europaea subsp. europaea TaxID=158383 RepID=A0A8S0USA5_OLEEU|nr:probable pre-mRNA-splicing factor ATP-dependent RNA helicase DEAH2 isoform X1 [Olea europaea subsp. europaea]
MELVMMLIVFLRKSSYGESWPGGLVVEVFVDGYRLVDIAPHYYDLMNFPNCEAKRQLEKLYEKRENVREESKNRK